MENKYRGKKAQSNLLVKWIIRVGTRLWLCTYRCFKRLYLFIFRERGREEETEGERHIDVREKH